MSNASLKDQLQAVASQLTDTLVVNTHSTDKQPKQQISKTIKTDKSPKSANPHPPKSDRSSGTKPKWLVYMQYGVELLRAYFPEGFKGGNEIKPLKKGIKQDLIKQLSTMEQIVTEDKACMVKSLSYYVNTGAYHKSVVEGAVRIDLVGCPSGVVSAEEAKYSKERQQAKQKVKQGATRSEPRSEQNQKIEANAELTQ